MATYAAGTFIGKLFEDLQENGMMPMQADEVMQSFMHDQRDSGMRGRWYDDPTGYPPVLYNLQWGLVCTYALKYIDEQCPKAWFRPVFLPPSAQAQWMRENGAARKKVS